MDLSAAVCKKSLFRIPKVSECLLGRVTMTCKVKLSGTADLALLGSVVPLTTQGWVGAQGVARLV